MSTGLTHTTLKHLAATVWLASTGMPRPDYEEGRHNRKPLG